MIWLALYIVVSIPATLMIAGFMSAGDKGREFSAASRFERLRPDQFDQTFTG